MVMIEEDITDLEVDVDFLFDETVIQDQRLLNLEEETSIIDEEVEGRKKNHKSTSGYARQFSDLHRY